MTSELASISHNGGIWQLHSSSKAALNMLIKGFAGKHQGDKRTVLLVAPGWIRTDMGGAQATYSIEETIPQVVQMISQNMGTPGLKFVDRFGNMLPW